MALSKQEVERLIRQTARENGADDIADLLVATAIQETGLDLSRPGDNGKSWGAFQEHDAGRGAGIPKENRLDVAASTKRAIAEFRVMQKKYPNADPGTIAVFAQRPREDLRPGYIANVNASVTRMQSGQPAVAGADGSATNGLPTFTLLSDDEARAITQRPGSAASAGGSAWPLPGGKVSNKFGGAQGRSPGMKGSLPGSNVGVDVSGVAEGTGVVAPVSGEVVKVYQSAGVGNADENGGWGGMVLIKGNDGYFHRLSHLQQGSVGVKAGDAVRAGQPVAKVGATGNTMAGGKGPFVHVDWEKFQTNSGNPDDRKTMSFTDPTLGGDAVSNSAGAGGTGGTKVDQNSPQYQADRNAAIQRALDNNQRLKEAEAKLSGLQNDPTWQADAKALGDARDWIAKYEAQWAKDHPGTKVQAPPQRIDKNPGVLRPGDQRFPWDTVDNPEYAEYAKNKATERNYTQKVDGNERPEKIRYDASLKAIQDAEKVRDNYKTDVSDKAGVEFDNDADARATAEGAGTIHIDSESGIVLDKNGKPIGNLPRNAKPGTVFNVPGRGTYIVNADGTGADLLVEASNKELYDWKDAGDRLIEVGPNGPTGKSIAKGELGAKPTVLGGTNGKTLTIWDPATKSIRTIPNDGREPKGPTAVTAPRDTRFIVRQDEDGKVLVEDNPNYDPTTGSVTGTSSTGRVYRVGVDGKATITDVLTSEERAVYDRGKLADTTKVETETNTALLDAATKLMDAELKQRQQEVWSSVQKVIADPNATSDQIIGAIQAGAKDATEWTNILRAHVEQRTQEEVGRHNKVTEGVSIQEADRALREGLYKDINETRNQRTNAQNAATQAIQGSGVIGLADSANVLSAMAPQIGSDGIKKIGTAGLGVGALAIDPVVKSWEEHQAELQKLQGQMPAIRMADPNVQGPSFAMPRGDASKLNIPPPGDQKGIAAIIDKAKQGILNAGKPGDVKTNVGLDTGATAPAPAAAPTPETPVIVDNGPTGLPDQPAPQVFPPTGPVVPGGSPFPPDEEGEGLGKGGGYSNGKIRFRVPQPKKRKVAA